MTELFNSKIKDQNAKLWNAFGGNLITGAPRNRKTLLRARGINRLETFSVENRWLTLV